MWEHNLDRKWSAYIQEDLLAVLRVDGFPLCVLLVHALPHHAVDDPLPLLMIPPLLFQQCLHTEPPRVKKQDENLELIDQATKLTVK